MATIDRRRRSFLFGRDPDAPSPVRPPWSSDESINSACVRCGACLDACPQGIIRIGEGGLPAVDFSAGECTFCGACARACPEPVFDRRCHSGFLHVAAITDTCLAKSGVHCQSCADACPEAAIVLRPRLGGPPVPKVINDRCTGCGACIAMCPAEAVAPARRVPEALNA